MSYLSFIPVYQPRVWGGFNFERYLERTIPHDTPIGESWDIVDRPEAQSIIKRGPFKGMSLRKALEFYAEDIIGPHWPVNKRFPIIIKWLDCQEKLSLQVHPPKNLANELQGESKCENWYIAQTYGPSQLFAGLKKGITQEKFISSLQDQTLETCIHTLRPNQGDSLFIPSGRIHAIGAGNLILEVQENSDTTYRAYDWGRLGLDGKPRQLHLEKSLKSINFNDFEPSTISYKAGTQTLVECPSFRIRKYDLAPGDKPLDISVGQGAALISIVKGQLRLIGTSDQDPSDLKTGSTLLLPYSKHFSFEAVEISTILMIDHFAR